MAVRKDHADLEIPRVIPRAGERCDLALGQLGREPLQADVGKTHRGHRAAQLHRATRRHRQRREPPLRLEQRQIIRRIYFYSVSGNILPQRRKVAENQNKNPFATFVCFARQIKTLLDKN